MKPPRWLEVEQSKDASGIYARVRVKWWAVPLVLAWALKENFRAWWLGVAAVAALLVGGIAGADSVPSPAPDAAKGRRGLVGAGPGEQVFSGRKVFDGGVEVQGPLVADAGAVFRGTPSAFSGVVQIDQRAQTNAAGLVLLNGGAGDNGIFFEGGPSSGGMSISTTNGLFGPRSTNRCQIFSVNSDVYSAAGSPAFDFTATAYASGVLARWRSGTVPIMEHYIDGGTTFDGGVTVQRGPLVVTGAPGTAGLTEGTPAMLASYNSSIGAGALWFAVPTTSNFTLSTATTAGGTYALQGTVLNAPVGPVYLSNAGTPGAVFAPSLGAGSTDVAVKVGSSVADGTVNAGAKLFSVRTGIGGTEVESLAVFKGGTVKDSTGFGSLTLASGGTTIGYSTTVAVSAGSGAASFTYLGSSLIFNSAGAQINDGTTYRWNVQQSGYTTINGTDSSGTPGAATINKPRGISAIAIGASTVTITNSLAATTSHIMITPLARDTTCKELAVTTRSAGSFVVSCTANATAAVVFAWEVGGLL